SAKAKGNATITATLQYLGRTYTDTCQVAVTEEKILPESISIGTEPHKITYALGEELDSTGLRVNVRYSNGMVVGITEGFTLSGFDSTQAGIIMVTATYEGMTASFAVTILPEKAPEATLPSVTARAGDTVEMLLVLSDAPLLRSVGVSAFEFDHDKLELVSGQWLGDFLLSDFDCQKEIGAASLEQNGDLNGNLLKLTFRVKQNDYSENLTVSLRLTAMQTIGGTYGEYPVSVAVNPGSISIAAVLKGDLNEDNVRDFDDAIYLLYHTMFQERYPVNQNVDYNGDGIVSIDDAIYLLFHVYFPNDYQM
ncbi:MAG: bacterial Ig-like domain-containing protein, partial [Clostridia bacterium]|nr:bacterial Ig-like domain-containing protein [Clostridia bacterium]